VGTEVRTVAVVPAAGAGQRLGAGIPKAFIDLDGQSLIERALAGLRASGAVDGGAAPRGRAAAIALAGEVARDHDQEREGARACGEPRGAGVARAVEDGAAGADGRGAAHRGHPAVLGAERASIDFAILRGPWP